MGLGKILMSGAMVVWLTAVAGGQLATVVPADAKAFEQIKQIRRCVNVLGYDPIWRDRQKARFQEKHFRLIHEAGFQAIRVNLHALGQMDAENRLSNSWWQTLDWIVKNAQANQLAVILDLHNFTDVAADPNAFKPKIMAFWKQVGEHFKDAPDTIKEGTRVWPK